MTAPNWFGALAAWMLGPPPSTLPAGTLALIQEAEHKADLLIARLRLAIGATLALAVVSIPVFGDLPREMNREVVSFQLTTAFAICFCYMLMGLIPYISLRRRRMPRHHAWILATLEVIIVAVGIEISTINTGFGYAQFAVYPSSWLVPIIIAFSSLRYDALMVVYVTGLFVVGFAVGSALYPDGSVAIGPVEILTHGPPNAMRLLMLSLAGAVLAVGAARTRRLLIRSVTETQARETLARHLPKEVADAVGSAPVLSGREQEAAILFVDIRGFTSLSESMAAADLGRFLSDWRGHLSTAVRQNGGVIDKFIGDGALIIFGIPTVLSAPGQHALRACAQVLRATAAFNQDLADAGQAPIEIVLAVHRGPVWVGIVGDDERREFTVLGDTVNVASRLEGVAKATGHAVVVSQSVRNDIAHEKHHVLQSIGTHEVRGHRASIELYAAVPADLLALTEE